MRILSLGPSLVFCKLPSNCDREIDLTEAFRYKLRTVPSFVASHTFCASRDTWVYGWCLVIQGYFLRDLKLCGESRPEQVLLVSKKKIGGNHAFFRDNRASIWKTTAIHCFVFYYFLEYLLLNYL